MNKGEAIIQENMTLWHYHKSHLDIIPSFFRVIAIHLCWFAICHSQFIYRMWESAPAPPWDRRWGYRLHNTS